MKVTIFVAMVTILVCTTLISNAFAYVSSQKRYDDGYNAGQDYAACDYDNCDHSNHGYDMGCPTDKKHTYEFCQGYSLGYQSQWNSLAGEVTSTQQQSQAQAQDGSSVHIDGDRNTVIINPRQDQEQSSSSSQSDSQHFDNSESYGYR